MPEGHSVHRIARLFLDSFVGKRLTVSSPQGRFAAGAADLDGHVLVDAFAVGKQLFMEFDHGLWLRVHLGMYGAWDFAGAVVMRAGQTGEYSRRSGTRPVLDTAAEDSISSIGAPRRTRLRVGEGVDELGLADARGDAGEGRDASSPDDRAAAVFPPEPIGQVRVRLLADDVVADLRGPTACEVLLPDAVQAKIDEQGPDPMHERGARAEQRFIDRAARKPTPIGIVLMDQKIVSGIGNVYRAELLFRARQNPWTPAREVGEETLREIWRDWVKLLRIGVEVGQMMTIDGLRGKRRELALRNRDDRHWVYHRAGLPCRVCGTPIIVEEMQARKLYWCPSCQA